eukprot:TRINITY_DN2997_c0_g1_i2.p1 TRINITY_DN2997_c0_g1~~TRINITY_DN2997_c0_g1_i2.p1  ORF type:complete len:619 (+),score=99.43 TRINITY_DN2997_c0_g1_i2:53-1909(+)
MAASSNTSSLANMSPLQLMAAPFAGVCPHCNGELILHLASATPSQHVNHDVQHINTNRIVVGDGPARDDSDGGDSDDDTIDVPSLNPRRHEPSRTLSLEKTDSRHFLEQLTKIESNSAKISTKIRKMKERNYIPRQQLISIEDYIHSLEDSYKSLAIYLAEKTRIVSRSSALGGNQSVHMNANGTLYGDDIRGFSWDGVDIFTPHHTTTAHFPNHIPEDDSRRHRKNQHSESLVSSSNGTEAQSSMTNIHQVDPGMGGIGITGYQTYIQQQQQQQQQQQPIHGFIPQLAVQQQFTPDMGGAMQMHPYAPPLVHYTPVSLPTGVYSQPMGFQLAFPAMTTAEHMNATSPNHSTTLQGNMVAAPTMGQNTNSASTQSTKVQQSSPPQYLQQIIRPPAISQPNQTRMPTANPTTLHDSQQKPTNQATNFVDLSKPTRNAPVPVQSDSGNVKKGKRNTAEPPSPQEISSSSAPSTSVTGIPPLLNPHYTMANQQMNIHEYAYTVKQTNTATDKSLSSTSIVFHQSGYSSGQASNQGEAEEDQPNRPKSINPMLLPDSLQESENQTLSANGDDSDNGPSSENKTLSETGKDGSRKKRVRKVSCPFEGGITRRGDKTIVFVPKV